MNQQTPVENLDERLSLRTVANAKAAGQTVEIYDVERHEPIFYKRSSCFHNSRKQTRQHSHYRAQEIRWKNTILTQINSARRIPENTILQPSWSARFKCNPKQFSLPNRSNRSNDMLKQFSQRSRMNPLIPFCIQGLARQYGIESIYNRNCA